MGWLGWSEEQTLDTTIPAIVLAVEGRTEMLKLCFGTPDEPKSQTKDRMDPEKMKSIFRAMGAGRKPNNN
jgi:hypothetical protein